MLSNSWTLRQFYDHNDEYAYNLERSLILRYLHHNRDHRDSLNDGFGKLLKKDVQDLLDSLPSQISSKNGNTAHFSLFPFFLSLVNSKTR